ncbi:MAG: TonB-dependent receptor [Bacteroidales bacterium]|nr:TonB-dependent receptor [Bacteroidales bacterium]
MRKVFLLGLFLLLIPFSILAQNIKVTGKVIDGATNETLVGVNVVQAGTTNGTITDLDGNFEINVPSDSKLTFSYIGYLSQTLDVAGKTTIICTLSSDDQQIDEVVVVGYGTQRKSDLTGSVASVKSSDLQNRSTTDAAAALQGKASGIQVLNSSGKPGQGASIRVRGYSSNSSNIGPLLIVDGLQVSSIQYLDPSMIESMEVLKDAASAAIYGAEAGNGVVLITTKSGKKGQGSISYEAKFTNQQLGKVPQLLNATQFSDWMSRQITEKQFEADKELAMSRGWDPNTNTNWLDEYFENTWAQQHTLSFQGGNDRGSYFASISNVSQDGIVKGSKDKYNRLTAQLNADYKIKDWLKIGTNTSIEKWASRGVSENGYGTAFETLMLIDPLTPVYWKDETKYMDYLTNAMDEVANGKQQYRFFGDENGMFAGSSYFFDRLAGGNPFAQRDRAEGKSNGVNVNGTAFVNITPIKAITYTSRLGYRISYNNSSDWQYPFYINPMCKSEDYKISGGIGNSLWYNWENFVNYNQTFADKHTVSAMAGMSYRQGNSNNINASASGPDILKDYKPNWIYLSYVNSNEETSKAFDGTPNTSRAISYFGRLMYSFDNRYSVQANFRADAFDSSKLSADNRWGKFFSASLGWTFSNESFFKDNIDSDIMSFGKFRASWGQNGNVNVLGGFPYTAGIATNSTAYSIDAESNTVVLGSKPNKLPNPELTWETSEQIDLGLDMRFLNDRLTLGLDWYKKTTKDLLVNAKVLAESGMTEMMKNAGEVENKGFEVELSWKDKIGGVNYSVTGNLATLKNNVTYLEPSIDRIQGGGLSGANPETIKCWFEQDHPIWYMRGYKYLGLNDEGKPLYQGADGNPTDTPTDGDMTEIGSGLPSMTYGLTISADYKGFDLSLFGTGTAGNDIYYNLYRTNYANVAEGVYDMFNGKDMPDPSLIAGDKVFWSSSALVYNGSFFKIKQIQLGYTLPSSIVKKAYMQNVRAYVSLDDFFTFTKYIGLDPETCTQSYNAPGLDMGAYPNMRKIVLGFNITF